MADSRYELLERLGQGEISEVQLGVLRGPNGFARKVAIKTLRPGAARDHHVAIAMIDGAREVSGLRHPNVVSIVDLSWRDGRPALILEYVDGISLAALIGASREPLPIPLAVAIACGLLQGLHAVHEFSDERGRPLGIVHGDVSAKSVLIGRDGIAKLSRLGLAPARRRIRPGPIADRRSDVYEAAAVLFELVTGHTPRECNYAPPSELNPAISPDLEAVIVRALSRDPARRFLTAMALVDALELAVTPVPARAVMRWLVDRELELRALETVRTTPVAAPPAIPTLKSATSEPAPLACECIERSEQSERGERMKHVSLGAIAVIALLSIAAILPPSGAPAPSVATLAARCSDSLSAALAPAPVRVEHPK